MAFAPENSLEYALVEGASSPAAWAAFYRLLLNAELFALGLVEAGPGAKKEIRLAQIEFKNRIYHPIFSSPSRMGQYAKEHPKYFGIKGRELFQSARGAYFLLNPGSEYAKELLPEEIAEMLGSEDPVKAPAAGTVLISKPVVFPLGLAEALANLFATRPGVEAAYLAQMTIAGKNEPPHPIVGVKYEGEWEPLAKEIERVVAPLPHGTRLAAIQIGADEVRKALGDMLMRYEPFYVRTAKLH